MRSNRYLLPSRRPVKAEGERPTVIALHAAAGTPQEWRPLAECLRVRYRVLAPDLDGYAAGRAAGVRQPLSLDAEAARSSPCSMPLRGPCTSRAMPELCAELDAQLKDPTPLAGYARSDVPVWLLTGARTCAATVRIARLLAGTLSRAEWGWIDGADRMGPSSHPEAVDREIEGFLAQQQASGHRDPEPMAVFGRPVFRCRDDARECAEAVSL